MLVSAKVEFECIPKCFTGLGLYIPTKFESVKSDFKMTGESVTGRGWGMGGLRWFTDLGTASQPILSFADFRFSQCSGLIWNKKQQYVM